MSSPIRLFISLLFLTLVGCASIDTIDQWSAKKHYDEAQSAFESGDYQMAIERFEDLEIRFPFSPYTQQGQLEIAYAYYKFDEPDSSIAAADRFIRLYPRHPNIDYAFYLKGLASFHQGMTSLDLILKLDPSKRDSRAARESFRYFSELLRRFPESKYAADASQRMTYLRNNLAQYEIHVADYYMRRKAYLAAANRGKYVVENYPKTPAMADALAVMVKAYRLLELNEQADDAQRVLRLNYPDHPLSAEE